MSRRSFTTLDELVAGAEVATPVAPLSGEDLMALERGVAVMDAALRTTSGVYGVTHGFGALVDHPGGGPGTETGVGLIHHLATGQGPYLDPRTCRLAVLLRLSSMRQGYSAVTAGQWQSLADIHDRGFVPALPQSGTVSASGDLQPLAAAALAFAGRGHAWVERHGEWTVVDSSNALRELGCEPVSWPAVRRWLSSTGPAWASPWPC